MKEIKNFNAEKYIEKKFFVTGKGEYREIEHEIYEYKQDDEVLYVTSLSFVQEPEFNEGKYADNISQYPLEDLLDKFYCHISDFYEELNAADSKICYLEFAAMEIDDIKNLRRIIGKHVYNRASEKNGNTYIDLLIE